MIEEMIDPPVTPYSSVAEIEVWVAELEARILTEAVRDALTEASNMLVFARAREAGK